MKVRPTVMATSESQKRASVAYRARQRDAGKLVQLAIDMLPEEREWVKEAAQRRGKPVKRYILDLIEMDMEELK